MATQTKQELVDELASNVTKDELVKLLGSRLKKEELQRLVDSHAPKERQERRPEPKREDGESDAAQPSLLGRRVRVDLAGLPMLGVFAGKGASAAGTIVGIDASERGVRVYLDAGFDGRKELLLPPERVALDV